MICLENVKLFCRDEISKIENYAEAMSDSLETWHCHHRWELTINGEKSHSANELKKLGLYYNRPYFELVFLRGADHTRLHNLGKVDSEETKRKKSLSQLGHEYHGGKPSKPHSQTEATKKKISEALKGRIGPNSGKHFSEEHRRKLSEALKRARAQK